ncbi:Fanconi anemia group D2 protein homolog [Anopheles aquasalis]|uniref:Fanconi anemia group D2 protein homolog n=1 Tax=Anopheles aquasalis TaxID=42839 RepID=UPI00215A19F9|nr:Fanconi anemia group D2 protein homolog [Anopheles aquasalis]
MNELYSQNKRRRQAKEQQQQQQQNENEDDIWGSQFSVPASQAPSQRRYLSQRSNLQRSQSVKTGLRAPVNYYESVLLMAGLSLDEPGGVVVLKCEPIVFMHKLKNVLRTNSDYPANIDRFLAGIKLTMNDRTNFLKLLECCQVQPTPSPPTTTATAAPVTQMASGEMARKPVQESLMKMFLLVDFLQLKLIELLFAYLTEELDKDASPGSSQDSIVGFVLSQLKFIDHVQNGDVVFEKVFELLAKANRNGVVFDEIIFSMEDVIDVSKHDDALRRLLKLRPKPEDLITPTTVEVFTGMCLNVETLELLRRKVIQYASDGCPLRYYPSLVKMLLKFNRNEPQENLHAIVREVRKLLDTGANPDAWTTGSGPAEDCAEQILRTIYQGMMASATLFDCWIASIKQLPAAEDHLPIDLLLLTMATTINEVKAPRIRKLTIKKISQEFFTDSHTDQLVSGCFRWVLQNHLDSFLQLIEGCTREKAEIVSGFGVASLSALFALDQSIVTTDNRVVLSKIVGFICEMASANVVSRNDFLIGRCIAALRKLHESHPREIERSAELLLKILDIAPELSLRHYRPLIGVIYAAAIPKRTMGGAGDDETASGNESIRDNLEIIVKKQLLCDCKDTKKKGIVGLVQMVYHLSLTPGADQTELSSSFDSERTIGTISEIPSAVGRTMANLISTLFLSTNQSADLLAICYDELATMIAQPRSKTAPGWEKTFIMWLTDMVTMDFQLQFLVDEDVPLISRGEDDNAIRLARQLCINRVDEEDANVEAQSIAVNVAGVVLAHQSRHTVSTYLAPIFRLMRTLHAVRYDGSLVSINALLGCAIVVPSFYGDIGEEERRFSIDSYDETLCTQLLDVYFCLGNWFRECIGAFVGHQQDATIRRKVIARLQELVKLEHHLRRMLDRMSGECEYGPPLASDHMEGAAAATPITSKKAKPANEPTSRRKKASTNPHRTINLDGTLSSQAATTAGVAGASAAGTVGHFNEQSLLVRYGYALRRIDPELVQLFEIPLRPVRVLEPADQQSGSCIALPEYRCVLANVALALEQPDTEVTFQRRMIDRWTEFAERTAMLMNGLRDSTGRLQPASAQELLPLKSCYLWSLRLATALLGWKRFREPRGRQELERVLRVLAEKMTESAATGGHLADVAKLLLKELIVREACYGDLSIAAQLYHLGQAIGENVGERNVVSRAIAKFTRSVLTAPEFQRSASAESKSANQHFVTLLDGMIGTIGMKSLKQLIVEMGQDLSIMARGSAKGKSKGQAAVATAAASAADGPPVPDDAVRTFVSFKRSHYALLFKGLCRAFIRLLQDEIRIRSGGSSGTHARRLELWEAACEATGELTNIVRRAQQPANFGVFLRFAQIFIKLFLKSGLPVLEVILRSSAERASNLLSTLQNTTRYLHNVCCQAKVGRGADGAAGAVAQIPYVRECVETLVYRVKAALVANRCSAVFWMGNLRNKDTHGELILSQSVQDDDDDDEEDGEAVEEDGQERDNGDSDIADNLSDEEESGAVAAAGAKSKHARTHGQSSTGSIASLTKSSQSKCF